MALLAAATQWDSPGLWRSSTPSALAGANRERGLLSKILLTKQQDPLHQQIKETPAINYNTVKRIITGCKDYNPPVRIITDYTTVPVSGSLWNCNKIIYYLSRLHSFLSFIWNILPYQFRNPYGVAS